MRRLVIGTLAAVTVCLVAGCGKDNMGQSDTDIAKQSQAWKTYNEDQQKKNPPPPGEGPSN